MKSNNNSVEKFTFLSLDAITSPFTLLSAIWLKLIRRLGTQRMGISKSIFNKVGVFPIRDHYYEPMFNGQLRKSLREDRVLPGIDLNVDEQLEILSKFHFNNELLEFPSEKKSGLEYFYQNPSFQSGDSEYLYNIIRLYKPSKIVEIGSGYSTQIAAAAIRKNRVEDSSYMCNHICVEPYEHAWLEQLNVQVIRNLVEDVDKDVFQSLGQNDILFIDSSHMIRPQGDVLVEYLEILPLLKPGVFVHIHDIFTPKDYLDEWVVDLVRFWNEQYLLEAFLSFNAHFKIVGALNYLKHNFPKELCEKCPVLEKNLSVREPGSFWLLRK